jgi:hypothetical protein
LSADSQSNADGSPTSSKCEDDVHLVADLLLDLLALT